LSEQVSLDSSPPKVRKVRSDKKYSSNAERQRAYELRKKALDIQVRIAEEIGELLAESDQGDSS